MRSEVFAVGEAPRLVVRLGSASLDLRAGPAGEVRLEIDGRRTAELVVEQFGDTVTVSGPRPWLWGDGVSLRAGLPPGTDLEVSLGAGDLGASVPVGELKGRLASADVQVGEVRGGAELKAASGDVRIGTVVGRVRVTTASGDVHLGVCEGACSIVTASGDAEVDEARGNVEITTASGDVQVERASGEAVTVRTVSGSLTLGLPAGCRVDLDASMISGNSRLPAPPTDAPPPANRPRVRVSFRSVSGDLEIRRMEK